jgi:N-methylhydantoinase A
VLNDILDRLEVEGRAALREEGFDGEDIVVTRALEMRYSDQVHECAVAVPETGLLTQQSIERIKELFHRRHEQLYTYCERDNEPELVNVEVTVIGRTRAGESVSATAREFPQSAGEVRTSARRAYFEELGGFAEVPVSDGRQVPLEHALAGPAIIEETTTTIVVPPGWAIALKAGGFYLMTHRA